MYYTCTFQKRKKSTVVEVKLEFEAVGDQLIEVKVHLTKDEDAKRRHHSFSYLAKKNEPLDLSGLRPHLFLKHGSDSDVPPQVQQ